MLKGFKNSKKIIVLGASSAALVVVVWRGVLASVPHPKIRRYIADLKVGKNNFLYAGATTP